GPANDGDRPRAQAERGACGLQRRAAGIPEPRLGVVGVGRGTGDAAGDDQPAPAGGVRMAFLRTAAVHHRVDMVEPVLEVAPVGVELERGRLDAARVGNHAVSGGDDVGFNAKGADHASARYSVVSLLTSDRNSLRVAGWSRNTPSIRLVTRSAPRLRTPRSIMQ